MYRILLDTNILLDSVIPNRPQHDEALALLKWCNGSGDYGFAAATWGCAPIAGDAKQPGLAISYTVSGFSSPRIP